jgi:hypothetical protein
MAPKKQPKGSQQWLPLLSLAGIFMERITKSPPISRMWSATCGVEAARKFLRCEDTSAVKVIYRSEAFGRDSRLCTIDGTQRRQRTLDNVRPGVMVLNARPRHGATSSPYDPPPQPVGSLPKSAWLY